MHALAFDAIEELAGGSPPEPPPVDDSGSVPLKAHRSDPWARELAEHAREAGDAAAWLAAERGFTQALELHRGAGLVRGSGDAESLARRVLEMKKLCANVGVTPLEEPPA